MSDFWDKKWTEDYGAFHKKYYVAYRLLNKSDINKKILDFGSGNGNFFDLLIKHGFKKENLYTYDISKKAIEICQKKGYKVIEDLNESINFDIISLIDVLEHIADPYEFLNKLKTKTKEFIVIVPNFNSYKQRIEVLLGKIPFQNKIQRGGHILWVNYNFLLDLFEKLNLEIVDNYHLYSKTKGKNSLSYRLQNNFPNFFANSFGFRLEVL